MATPHLTSIDSPGPESGYYADTSNTMESPVMANHPPPVPAVQYAHSPHSPSAPPLQQQQQQHRLIDPAKIGNTWKTGLFDCDQNETNAVMTAFFPCVTFGQIAEILDEGETSCTLSSFMYILMVPALLTCWILGSNYRQRLRNRYNLVQAPAEDWTVHLFCPCCALCQEFRELSNRGIDPSLGWMGYLAQQQETTISDPPKSQFMTK